MIISPASMPCHQTARSALEIGQCCFRYSGNCASRTSSLRRWLGWAEDRRWIAFLDVQIGGSSLTAELARLVKYLERPYVHLALDPEYAMQRGGIPGRRVGTLDAAQVNEAVQLLTTIVDQQNIPPKVLVVHRFTRGMLTNHREIKLDQRVQVG
jgi:hypothetical protein